MSLIVIVSLCVVPASSLRPYGGIKLKKSKLGETPSDEPAILLAIKALVVAPIVGLHPQSLTKSQLLFNASWIITVSPVR